KVDVQVTTFGLAWAPFWGWSLRTNDAVERSGARASPSSCVGWAKMGKVDAFATSGLAVTCYGHHARPSLPERGDLCDKNGQSAKVDMPSAQALVPTCVVGTIHFAQMGKLPGWMDRVGPRVLARDRSRPTQITPYFRAGTSICAPPAPS